MLTNPLSLSEAQQQSRRIRNDIPSRFDLNTGDICASELLDSILTNCCPKSWYYFLQHILTSKVTETSSKSSHSSPNHRNYSYSFETFNKFFANFKSSTANNHKYITENNTFYTKIWLLHVRSHILEYERKHRHSKSRSFKKQNLRNISAFYKQLFVHQIGRICSEFYIEWAKYYILCKKYEKAKKKIKIGMKANAQPIQELNTFYTKLNNIQNTQNTHNEIITESEYNSYSDLSTSSDSDSTDAALNTDSENDEDTVIKHTQSDNDDHTANTRCILGTPRRVFNEEEKSNDEDEEHEEHHLDIKKRLSVITENDTFITLSPKVPKSRVHRTPFAAINGNNANANTANVANNISLRLRNIANNKPFTPNTLLRNMANNKAFSFSNRVQIRSKTNNIDTKENKTSSLYRNDSIKRIPSPMITPNHRGISEPISPSWSHNKLSISPPEHPLSLITNKDPQPCLKKRRTSNHEMERKRQHNVDIKKKQKKNERNNINNDRNHSNHKYQMNMTTVNDRKMMQLKCIGRGGSSKVYKVITKDTFDILALKKVTVSNSVDVDDGDTHRDPMENFLNEIDLLNKLRNMKYCIQMLDYEIVDDIQNNCKEIRMLFECGEIDLAHLLKKQSHGCFENIHQIWFYWTQMLAAVDKVHGFRIVHGDLKPANFLLVKGELKLIDFGIAKQIQSNETTRIARDSQIGTLNYICPEALISSNSDSNCYKLGRSADVWSLGCILHQMAFGFTPFTHLKFGAKLQCIVGPTSNINIKTHKNQSVNDIIRNCLIREPHKRISIKELLEDANCIK